MQDLEKISATVITGFLGAGKTTLIRNLLETANGRRLALIINEFGDIGVDGDVLKECGDENCSQDDLVELTNGCICCTVADDFVPTMKALIERDRKIDHIVIETSGLALPQPLVSAFNWPEIRERVTVDGVITVVDAHAVSAGRFADDEERVEAQRRQDSALDHENPLEELFEDQIGCADMIVLNKSDLVDTAGLVRIEQEIEERIARPIKLVRARQGALPAEILLGLGSATENEVANRKSHHEREHEAGADHDHDEFDSFVVELGPIGDLPTFLGRLQTLIGEHDILRAKGFLAIEGKPMRLVLQAVGSRVDHYFDRDWLPGEEAMSKIVVIGMAGLDEAAIASALMLDK